jgi:hypothetical protein
MSGRTTKRKPEAELTVNERVEINNARQAIVAASGVLAKYGLHETAEPLTELGYEQRMARGRAAELAVQLWTGPLREGETWDTQQVIVTADMLARFIWTGEVAQDAAVER